MTPALPETAHPFLQRGGDIDTAAWDVLCRLQADGEMRHGGRSLAPLLVVRCLEEPALTAALQAPCAGLLEWPVDLSVATLNTELANIGHGLLSLRLSTASGIRLDVARHLANAAAVRLELGQHMREAVQLATHEAISNALVHGNLGLPGLPRRRVEDLEQFAASLRERLAQPVLANRRLAIDLCSGEQLLTVRVQDQGSGYAGSPLLAQQTYGRGLQIIRALTHAVRFSDGGRCIEMDFSDD